MRLALLLVVGALSAQTPPNIVAILNSPDNAAFASLTEKPNFTPTLLVYGRIISATERWNVEVTYADTTTDQVVVSAPTCQCATPTSQWKLMMTMGLKSGVAVTSVTVALVTTGAKSPITVAR